MDRSVVNLMKKGQILSGVHHKGKAIIVEISDVKVKIKWFTDASGNPMSDITRSHSVKDLQREIDTNNLILSSSNDPNLLFMMRKVDVHS